MFWFRKLRDKLIAKRVSHAAKILRKHQAHHKHQLAD